MQIAWQIGLQIRYVVDGCQIGGKNLADCGHIRTLTDQMKGQSASINMIWIRSDYGLWIPIRNPSYDANNVLGLALGPLMLTNP